MSNPGYDIEQARREWLGRESDVTAGRYPVEYDPVRRFCHMLDDSNPLFLNPDYARLTEHGEVLCPPGLVDYFSYPGPWPRLESQTPVWRRVPTPGRRLVNVNHECFWYRPVKVGDRLKQKTRIVDIVQKAIRIDPEAVWITFEYVITNQRDEMVMVVRNQVIAHRSAEEVAAAREGEA